MTDLTKPEYLNPDTARQHLESIRWANGAFCPHCGEAENVNLLGGKAGKNGLWFCHSCKLKFTVTVGTLFERSHIPLNKWLLAVHLMASSKKGISSHQLHRLLDITYKSAWFMTHRIREAMKEGSLGPLGGNGSTVEADETFIGQKEGVPAKRGHGHKHAVLSLVERGGKARSFHVDNTSIKELAPILRKHVARDTKLMTDEAGQYHRLGKKFAEHHVINHAKGEYGRGEAHTNTIEGFFSIFKRGMKGVYQHCGEQHLKRYLTEFDFRYNNRIALGIDDDQRAIRTLKGIEGKRLTYRRSRLRAN